MKQLHRLVPYVILLVTTACGPTAPVLPSATAPPTTEAPTSTATPNPTSTRPPISTTTTRPPEETGCGGGALNFYEFLNYDEDAGKVDGRRFYRESDALKGDMVEITAQVLEARHFLIPDAGVDGTLVLVLITGDDNNLYEATIYLPDRGSGVFQFLPEAVILASGLHLGYLPPPENLFGSFPNVGNAELLPSMKAITASGGCSSTFPADRDDPIVGVWTSSGLYMQFTEEGNFTTASSLESLDGKGFDVGLFASDGDILTLVSDRESVSCAGGKGSFHLEVTADDILVVEPFADECSRIISRSEFTRVR